MPSPLISRSYISVDPSQLWSPLCKSSLPSLFLWKADLRQLERIRFVVGNQEFPFRDTKFESSKLVFRYAIQNSEDVSS